MSDRLVTIATFRSQVEANLAKSRLEAAGVTAFLADEVTVGMAWHLSNALGGVKLQVEDRDSQEALSILTESGASDRRAPGQAEEVLPPPSETEQPPSGAEPLPGPVRLQAEEPELALTSREQNADRALRGAVLGLMLLPLQFYVFWLLLKVLVSDEPLRPEKRRRAVFAAIINLPLIFGFGLMLAIFSA